MSDMTVKDFAVKVGRDVPRLLEQMKEAGLKHRSESDAVSEDDKQTLLSFLKKSHGGGDSEPTHDEEAVLVMVDADSGMTRALPKPDRTADQCTIISG